MTIGFGAGSTTDEVLAGVDLSGKRALVIGVSADLGMEAARELGIGFVAYRPLGRGFLTGRIKPVPETERRRCLEDNLGALAVTLGAADRERIEAILPLGIVEDTRYPASMMADIDA